MMTSPGTAGQRGLGVATKQCYDDGSCFDSATGDWSYPQGEAQFAPITQSLANYYNRVEGTQESWVEKNMPLVLGGVAAVVVLFMMRR